MNALSCAGGGGHGAPLVKGCSTIGVVAELNPAPSAGANKRKRRPAGTPDPDAEVVALSPRTLMESDRYICEFCNQGFQRDQNLQMHRRRHKVPWKLLKKPRSLGTNKRVYICPERSCLHHDPMHALGDLVGIKKHYRRKHCTDKQWKCIKCSKRYAVQSDYKAHLKTCGTRGHCCDCGRVFSRVESFIEHQDTCSSASGKTSTPLSTSSHPCHNTDVSIESPSPSPSLSSDNAPQAFPLAQPRIISDTAADRIASPKLIDEHPRTRSSSSNQVNQEVHINAATLPSWLIKGGRNNDLELGLELLPSTTKHSTVTEFSMQRTRTEYFSEQGICRTGPDSKATDLSYNTNTELHTPCLRLSIGPASSHAESRSASSCPSPPPSSHVDFRNPRFSDALASRPHPLRSPASTGALTRVLGSQSTANPTVAIGKDLTLSNQTTSSKPFFWLTGAEPAAGLRHL